MDRELRRCARIWQDFQSLPWRLAAVRRAGASWRHIADDTEIPPSTVRRWVSRYEEAA